MNVVFYASDKTYDRAISRAMAKGARCTGFKVEVRPTEQFAGPDPAVDLAFVVGVKANSGPILDAYAKAGKHGAIFDKGYTRIAGGELGTLYWRLSVNGHQPLDYFQKMGRPPDRWEALNKPIKTDRPDGQIVLFAGSSQKFCDVHGLGDANDYAAQVMTKAAKYTGKTIVYRPKPSWGKGRQIEGFGFSPPKAKFDLELARTHCLVTYGSNACFEALLSGVPAIVLGNGITRPICDTTLKRLEHPRVPSGDEVYRLACDVAYCQWTLDEMYSGLVWADVRKILER